MKKILLFSLLFFSLSLSAQLNLNHIYFQDTTVSVCPADTNQNLLGYRYWEAYQTYDDHWYGPRDTTQCINIRTAGINYNAYIRFSEIDTNRILFFRMRLHDAQRVALLENSIHMASMDSWGSPIDISQVCPDGYCSYMLVGVQIPDSFGTGRDMRYYSVIMGNGTGTIGSGTRTCFPTEYFMNGNALREFIFAFKFTNVNPAGGHTIWSPSIENFFWVTQQLDDSVDFLNYRSGPNEYTFYSWWGYDKFLVMHDTTYPGPWNIKYHDLYPVPNVPVQDTVRVYLNPPGEFLIQPHTELRGGYVQNDTIRHQLQLILQGADVCMYPIVEVSFEHGNGFEYRSGVVDFHGKMSCFRVGKQGFLKVADNSTFHYGQTTDGMLALRSGGRILIGKNSEFVVHNTIMLYEYLDETEPQNFFMTLGEGATFRFAKGARLKNDFSINQQMKLYVYMKGGTLDDSQLPESDRARIVRIYDQPANAFEDNFILYANPASSNLRFSMIFPEGQHQLTARLYDLTGRLLSEKEFAAGEGLNYFNYPVDGLPGEIYLLQLQQGENLLAKKVILRKN